VQIIPTAETHISRRCMMDAIDFCTEPILPPLRRALAMVGVAVVSLATVSCSSRESPPSPSPTSHRPPVVAVRGWYLEVGVSRRLPRSGSCARVALIAATGPTGSMTFYGVGDRVIARAPLTDGASVRFGGSCVPSWSFRVTLPRETAYAARGPTAGAQMQPATISYSKLAANHFHWKIEVH